MEEEADIRERSRGHSGLYVREVKERKGKKFWEELTAYFPLIRHGPHIKQKN
jgi:hypothetical protein